VEAGGQSGAALGGRGRTEAVEPSSLQRTYARRVAESKATIPHLYLRAEVDMGEAVALRERLRAALGDGAPGYVDMVVRAAALALREHPRLNGAYRDARFTAHSRVNVAVTVAAQETLILPVISDADQQELAVIAQRRAELTQRARSGEITRPELSGATFTVASYGDEGVDEFAPAVVHGQGALLAAGAVREAPLVRDGAVVAGHAMTLTLCCDQRLIQGAEGAAFLRHVRGLLEQPDRL
jgi:Pyruvate/2-oxoglutarate dehydrogenase complex, dihydrolipoamide acyltransferase (E2) component, and related enzymes